MSDASFGDLKPLAAHLREELTTRRFVLLYAYNGTGKTRLSSAFKDLGKKDETRDTLYFNAFTEDLFYWDNDLKNDRERVLKMNAKSHFFDGLREMEMNNLIRPIIRRYADFDFQIDKVSDEEWEASFSRDVLVGDRLETLEDIKVSRGEENIFIWCFFLAIVQLALDGADAYKWVQYIYIDDPVSSLDDNNAVMVAHHLAQMLRGASAPLKVIVSSHHVLFFNVLCNELRKSRKYFLSKETQGGGFMVRETDSTPFLYHLASLLELHEAQRSGALYTHHFNMMRRVMEQTACFFGYGKWEECIKAEEDDPDRALYKRVIDLMSHGDYSLYEPREMMQENKEHFRRVLQQFIARHPFSPALFPTEMK
jgi:hypothetical protein